MADATDQKQRSRSWFCRSALGPLGLLIGAFVHGEALLAQPNSSPASTSFGATLDGSELTCPPSPSDSVEMKAVTENVLRPDPKFDMAALTTAFQGEGFKAYMAAWSERQSRDWPYLCRYRAANAELLAQGERPDLVLMGDSITENWVAAHPDLFTHGFVGRGIGGQTSPQMLARFYSDVVALRPRVVQIMAGTNDIGGNTGPNLLSDYTNNINAMIDIAKANRIDVILAAIPPITKIPTKPDFDPRPNVTRINAQLKEIATHRNVVFVDYFSPLADSTGSFDRRYSNEGVHPNRDGYAIMAPLLQRAFNIAVRKQRR